MAEDKIMSEVANNSASGPTSQRNARDKGTFFPIIFGGALATVFGFFAAQVDGVEKLLGLGPDDNGLLEVVEQQAAQIVEQSTMIKTQSGRLSALQDDVDSIPDPAPAVDIAGLESRIAIAFSSLEARIVDLEKRPMTQGLSPEAVKAYEAELQRMQAAVADQRAEIQALLDTARVSETSAEEQAKIALARAALTRIITAVDTGKSFDDALAQLDEAGGVEIPDVLREMGTKGVPTLASLQDSFPEVARTALSAARSDEASSGEGGIGSFLQRQLGARSVTPQEGNSADAVLSRAEAAVKQGQIGEALSELDSLPEVAKAAVTGWLETARSRLLATDAGRRTFDSA